MLAEAEKFRKQFKDLFDGKLVFSGLYRSNGQGLKYPLYHVVWIPPENLLPTDGHEMIVDAREVKD